MVLNGSPYITFLYTTNLDLDFFVMFIGSWQSTKWQTTATHWYGVTTRMSFKTAHASLRLLIYQHHPTCASFALLLSILAYSHMKVALLLPPKLQIIAYNIPCWLPWVSTVHGCNLIYMGFVICFWQPDTSMRGGSPPV